MAGQTSRPARRPPPIEDQQLSKRRKIRKGTTSCWECKRRKTRCHFTSPTSEVCVGCQQRETPCVTQEYEEESGKLQDHVTTGAELLDQTKSTGLEDRLERVEALLQRLVDTGASFSSPGKDYRNSDTARPSFQSIEEDVRDIFNTVPGALKGGSGDNYSQSRSSQVSFGGYGLGRTMRDLAETESSNYESISRELYTALPSQHDANLIIAAGNTAPFLQFLCRPYEDIFRGEMLPASRLSAFPNSESHPVLIARTLLYLAHGIQNLHPSSLDPSQLDLGCPLATAMQRFLDTACRLVTSHDEIPESLEGLECLILEGVFHINAGNLRRAWLVFRKAISLAQLTGLDRGGDADLAVLDSTTMASPSFMWHRIVSQDRYLALMLGLPPGTPDDCLGSPEDLTLDDCPMGYLERIHCIIMSRITAMRSSKSDSLASIDLRSIDLTLEKAARGMPPEWWQPPIKSHGDGEALEDVLRIMFHITHFSLLIYLRLPRMLFDGEENTQNSNKSTCVHASRELLNRYIRFRCMDSIAFCCTSIDYSAFTACLTLLLAHLRRWHDNNGVDNGLAHQRLSDRAMVQETIELMMELGQESGDTVLEKTTGIVTSLSRIEADAAKRAGLYGGFSGTRNRHTSNRSLRLMIPSFGIVSITRDGIVPSASVTNSKGECQSQRSDTCEHSHRLPAASAELFQGREYRTPEASGVDFDMDMLQVPSLQTLGSQGHALQVGQCQSQPGFADNSIANNLDFSFSFGHGMDEWSVEAAVSLPECTDEQHDLFSGFLGSFDMQGAT